MMKRTKLLAVDHGTVRLGLAVSCVERRFAFPLEVRERAGDDAAFFKKLVEREMIGGLVVGLPVHVSGAESPSSVAARKYGQWLAGLTGLPVAFYDERYTTALAESMMWQAGLSHKKRQQRRDKVAAQILLQSYLDAGCPTEEKADMVPDILAHIVEYKWREISEAKAARPEEELMAACRVAPPTRSFRQALLRGSGMGVIAEVKRASPSAGVIRTDFDPVAIARAYEEAGASCVSVLTDEPSFGGKLDYLRAIRSAVTLPLLRKDFLLDRYQLLEARAAGADCVLLIAEILPGDELARLLREARSLGLESLVELYEPANLSRVLEAGADLVGVNNRDLRTFKVGIGQTLALAPQVPSEVCLVSESGIKDRADIQHLKAAGVRAVLVGETLMRAGDVARTMQELRA